MSRPTCKVIFLYSKRYCIFETEFTAVNDDYLIPGINILIDRLSYNVYKKEENKAFVAVIKKSLPKDENPVYALHPVNKDIKPEELKVAYSKPQIKAEGTFGKVEFFPTQKVVIKHSKMKEVEQGIPRDIVKEIGIYRLFKNLNCLPELYDFDSQNLKLEMSLGIGTLREAFLKIGKMEKKIIAFRLVKCLRAVASQGIIHCDLKPENIIISSEGKVQLIDWGIAEIDYSKGQTAIKDTYKQTLWYRSPEILLANFKNAVYSHKIDIFSLGLIFYELFTEGNILMPGKNEVEQIYGYLRNFLDVNRNIHGNIIKTKDELYRKVNDKISQYDEIGKNLIKRYPELSKLPEGCLDLISRMLEFNPKNRINYDEIILHPFFRDIEREKIIKSISLINSMPIISTREFHEKLYNNNDRKVLFEWLGAVCIKYKFSLDSLCLTFQLIDLYSLNVAKNKQMTCMACLGLATKLYETKPFVFMVNSIFTIEEVIRHESIILKKLNGNILIPSLYSYDVRKNGLPPVGINKVLIESYIKKYLSEDVYSKPMN